MKTRYALEASEAIFSPRLGKGRAKRQRPQDPNTEAPRKQSRVRHALKSLRWMAFERESFSELAAGG